MLTTSNETPTANFTKHIPCDTCGSSDANGLYDDGHTFCFSCETYVGGDGSKPHHNDNKPSNLLQGEAKALPVRGLTEADCAKFGYVVGTNHKGEQVQIANYRDQNGKIVAQKVRGRDKSFSFIGDTAKATLFGSHLWSNGKRLILVEGEIDALSMATVIKQMAICSIPTGAAGAVRAVKQNFEYINKFDNIIIAFDMDDAGQKAAQAVAEVLPVGKVLVASLPAKDANDAIVNGKGAELVQAIFQARPFRPDGIKAANDYRELITVDEAASSTTWPYSQLDAILRGVRPAEMVTLLAGSGTGKSTFCKEVIHHMLVNGKKVGIIALEESNKRTLLGLTGIHMNKNLLLDRTQATDEEVLEGFDDLFAERTCVLFDSFGSNEIDLICQRIQYMVRSLDVDFIVLDHISILVSATEGDERRMLDAACTKFRTLVQELNVSLLLVSHLSRPSGDRGHEAGAAVRLNNIRGSHSIAQLSDACIALQIDPEAPDDDIRHLRVLKNRFTGETGDAGTLVYDRDSGRLLEEALAQFEVETPPEEGETMDGEVPLPLNS